jgi:hypothetical protein
MERQKFPVGIESFEKLRKGGYVYVDKTSYIQKLVSEGCYYFLSRPRRFGKSLLLSTIKSFYEGRRELFDGLDISNYEWDWEPHPVFHLNLVNLDITSTEGLKARIETHLKRWESMYGAVDAETELSERFYNVIWKSVEQTGRHAVVLIDEYDKALVSTFDDEKLNESFRNILKPIYGVMKAADEYICFGMITGVTRFSRMSIFSDINNLTDISLDDRYAAICGITEEELQRDCHEGVSRLAVVNGWSYGVAMGKLKKMYDGYHFTQDCPDLYNPFSLFSALNQEKCESYWFSTGTPSFLIESLRDSDTYLPELFHSEADVTDLTDIDTYGKSVEGLLFQTGYLTIKGYDETFRNYILGFPNKEVAEGFFKDLLPVYSDKGKAGGMRIIRNMCRNVERGDVEGFLKELKTFLAGVPYDLSRNKPEIYFENNIYIIFKLMGFYVETEYRTSEGRIDLLVKTKQFIYVIELKLNGSASDAIEQIDKKGYVESFATDCRKVYKIGISFSKATRNIDEWMVR